MRVSAYGTTYTNGNTMNYTFADLKAAAAKLKALGTIHGPAVLTEKQLADVKKSLPVTRSDYFGLNFAVPESPLAGMPVTVVPSDADVMPMVHELRRRGKRPVFVGMMAGVQHKEKETMMKLPKPSEFGKYVFADGSIIYPAGKDYSRPDTGERVRMPNAGKFMLWQRKGTDEMPDGRRVPTGDFVMNNEGPVYFKNPMEALLHLESTP